MASAAQVGRTKATKARLAPVRIPSSPKRQTSAQIDAKLKDFVDRVVVPILVRDFLADSESEKCIAKTRPDMALCGAMPSDVEVVR